MKKIVKSALLVVVMMLISKILGLLREIFLAQQFGTSYIVDAYTVACTLPTVLFTLFASGFSNSYLPVYMRINNPEKKNFFFNNLVSLLTAFSLVLMVVCLLASAQIAKILAPGFNEETYNLTVRFVQGIVFYLPFYTAFNIFTAQATAYEDFIASNFCDFIVCNVVVIISIVLATPETPMVLIYGYVISMAVATGLMGLRLKQKKYVRFSFAFKINDSSFLQICSLALPMGIAMLTNQINSVVDKMFSSALGEGITSALSYANKVQLIPYSLITSIFLSLCLPRMNMCFANGDNKTGLSYSKRALAIALFIAVPVIFAIFAFSEPMIALLFERGAFDSEATHVTAACLVCYALGMPFYAFREIAAKTLTAVLQQKQVLKNTIIAVAVNILLNFIFVKLLGYKGLALATSVAGFCAAVLMNVDLKKNQLVILEKTMLVDLLKIFVASATSVGLAFSSFCLVNGTIGTSVATIASLCFAAVVYLLICIAWNVDIMIWAYSNFPKRFRIIKKWNES